MAWAPPGRCSGHQPHGDPHPRLIVHSLPCGPVQLLDPRLSFLFVPFVRQIHVADRDVDLDDFEAGHPLDGRDQVLPHVLATSVIETP
jgi:hypothetical protein